ncbi:hypothetical protein N7539_004856 [Penicillium diatomitis]|uniref:Uncharacterized protein n=1 Tax=Penicillium diatomitis TaxID=2819901 RepID=A0A9W9X5T8_9EURO|nr:uncharacterized protein N7539_004856 [Penicillium diatomitis]KAJ5484868.1 hypothetical protein N7539_004856 [Penicillium diatomitis]
MALSDELTIGDVLGIDPAQEMKCLALRPTKTDFACKDRISDHAQKSAREALSEIIRYGKYDKRRIYKKIKKVVRLVVHQGKHQRTCPNAYQRLEDIWMQKMKAHFESRAFKFNIAKLEKSFQEREEEKVKAQLRWSSGSSHETTSTVQRQTETGNSDEVVYPTSPTDLTDDMEEREAITAGSFEWSPSTAYECPALTSPINNVVPLSSPVRASTSAAVNVQQVSTKRAASSADTELNRAPCSISLFQITFQMLLKLLLLFRSRWTRVRVKTVSGEVQDELVLDMMLVCGVRIPVYQAISWMMPILLVVWGYCLSFLWGSFLWTIGLVLMVGVWCQPRISSRQEMARL